MLLSFENLLTYNKLFKFMLDSCVRRKAVIFGHNISLGIVQWYGQACKKNKQMIHKYFKDKYGRSEQNPTVYNKPYKHIYF